MLHLRWTVLVLLLILGVPLAGCSSDEAPETPEAFSNSEYERYESGGVVFNIPHGDVSKTSDMLRANRVPNATIVNLVKKHYRGGSVIDVGAHLGSIALPTAKFVGPRGRVFAFEPSRENARALRKSKADNSLDNLVIHEVALGDQKGTAYFTKGKKSGQGRVHLEQRDEVTYTVAIDTLDNFELPKIDFIKIDAEGHDIDIINGGARLIKRDRPVMFVELLEKSEYRGGLSRQEVIERIESLGYEASFPPGSPKRDLLFIPK